MLEQAYYVSGIIAAVGVIATLLYLAIQVRQNTRAMQLSTGHQVTEEIRSLYNVLAQNETLAEISFRGYQDISNLTGAEVFRFYGMMHDYFHTYQNAYFQMKSGTLDKRYWSTAFKSMRHIAELPGTKSYWQDRKSWYTSDFSDYFDRELAIPLDDAEYKLAGT